MDVSLFIASRLRIKGRMAMICIAVSFLVMIIAVSVSSGFRHAIRDGLAEVSGDIQITPVDMNFIGGTSPIERHPSWLVHMEALDGVRSVDPVVYRAGIVKNGDNIHGVVFKGVCRQCMKPCPPLCCHIAATASRSRRMYVPAEVRQKCTTCSRSQESV